MRVTLVIPLRDQLHFSIVSWSVDVTMTTNNHVFSLLWFLGVKLDDPESNFERVEKCSSADDGTRLANTWLQDVSGCAVSQRLALCGMQRKSSPCNGT